MEVDVSFPSPVKNVPRAAVGNVVNLMLLEQDVSSVEAHEQTNGKFTIVPHHSSILTSSSADIEVFKKSDFPV